MDAASSREQLSSSIQSEAPEDQIFRKYYTDRDYFLSPEGLLKVLFAIVCVVSSALFLSGGSCSGAPELVKSAATLAIVCSAATTLIYAGVVLDVPLYIPQAYLFTDIIISAVMGILLLISAVLSMTICEYTTITSYLHGPLAIVNAGMVTASAVMTYVSVMGLWDTAQMSANMPHPSVAEQEV